MSSLPPEFFGLFGLGQQLSQFGAGQNALRQQDRGNALQELEIAAQLMPNNRQALIQQAIATGLLPEDAAYTPTALERIQAGEPFESLSPTDQLMVGAALGLPPGMTPDLARRGATAGVTQTEQQTTIGAFQIDEMETAKQTREQFNTFINTPEFKSSIGLDPGMNLDAGGLEGYKAALAINSQQLANTLTSARTGTEGAQQRLMAAQTMRLLQEVEAMKNSGEVDPASAEWLKTVSLKTGWSPSVITAVMTGSEGVPDEVKEAVLKDVQGWQNGLRAAIQTEIRAGNSVSGALLEQMAEMASDGLIQIDPASPFWNQMMVRTFEEAGIPAAVVETPRRWLGIFPQSPARNLLIGEEATTAMEQALQAIGADAGTAGEGVPTIDATRAQQLASQMVAAHGDAEKALTALNATSLTPADKKLLGDAIRGVQNTGATPTGQTPQTPETVQPTPPAQAGPTLTELETEYNRKVDEIRALRNFEAPENESGSQKFARKRQINALAAEIRRLQSEIVKMKRTAQQ